MTWNIFERSPHSMCSQVSNNEHATSHHLTRLNVEFADLIATCKKWLCCYLAFVDLLKFHLSFHCSQEKQTVYLYRLKRRVQGNCSLNQTARGRRRGQRRGKRKLQKRKRWLQNRRQMMRNSNLGRCMTVEKCHYVLL